MSFSDPNCPICGEHFDRHHSSQADVFEGECFKCGWVSMTAAALSLLRSIDRQKTQAEGQDIARKMYVLSGLTRNAPKGSLTISSELIEKLRDGELGDRRMSEKFVLAMKWLDRKSSYLGEIVAIREFRDYPVAFCRHAGEFTNLLQAIAERGLIEVIEGMGPTGLQARLTPKGWEWLENGPDTTGRFCFVAMSFDPDLNPVSYCIQEAIRDAGYIPIRTDEDEYTGGVMDKVFAEIRRSRFVVADFTQNRGGVYFENVPAAQ